MQQQLAGAILEVILRVGVIPINGTPRHVLLTIFLSFYRRRVLNPLQGALCDVFCSKLCLIHEARLIRRHEITIFCQKVLLQKVKGWSRNHYDL